jgi:3-hydroxyisobutyrate dehydrogenase
VINRSTDLRLGWIGTGKMGYPLVSRLLDAGCDVAVYNRTPNKAEPLSQIGATLVDAPGDLADREIVFSVVSAPADFLSVTLGERGLLSDPNRSPRYLVDCSTISADASERVRAHAERVDTTLVAAPVSGNGKVVAHGGALFAVSGPPAAYEAVRPFLEMMGRGARYIGDGDSARVVKIAHNLLLGAITQGLVETTLLAQAAGITRRTYLDFINESPLGSNFSAYKTPALVALDWTPTFNTTSLCKDLELGLAAGQDAGVSLPLTRAVLNQVRDAIVAGHADDDFAAMLAVQAKLSGIQLSAEQGEADLAPTE